MKTEFLSTYGEYDEKRDLNLGQVIEVPIEWLESKVKDNGWNSLEEFLSEYTWDTTMNLVQEAKEHGVVISGPEPYYE